MKEIKTEFKEATIAIDFDGVILDTVDLKGDSFVELFSDYDQKTKDQIYKKLRT